MKRILIKLLFICLCVQMYGQRTCGSEQNLSKLKISDPERYQRIIDLENRTKISMSKSAAVNGGVQSTNTVIIIPIVVHIVYNNNLTQNISDAQVNSQLNVLNEDFNRLNIDKGKTPISFSNVAGSANIQFKLANKDPYGNYTSGITRTFTYQNEFFQNDNEVKFDSKGGHDAWNPKRYLNIWVCNLGGGLCGYAQFPSELFNSPNTDGVVINYKYFGRDGSAISPYNKGRTATHEIGHWLNLRHIWGDDDDGNGACSLNECDESDEVDDTPNQGEKNFGCPIFPLTDCCTTSSSGVMFMNYMDYTDDACMNMFTNGQIERMRDIFNTQRTEMFIYSHCNNGVKDSNETGIDCGGECPICSTNTGNPNTVTNTPTCSDGIKNQNETDIDCGGICLPCVFKKKPVNVLSVSQCKCGNANLLSTSLASPSLFSGLNILNSNNIKLSHGYFRHQFSYSYWVDAPSYRMLVVPIVCGVRGTNCETEESILNGGLIFEENNVQFVPYKKYVLKFNYWYNPSKGIQFSLANGLTNTFNKIETSYAKFSNEYIHSHIYYTYRSLTDNLPQLYGFFNIGQVGKISPPNVCIDNNNDPRRPYFADYSYAEVSITFIPDNYYKQLWVVGNNIFFNSLKIEEFCITDLIYNQENTKVNVEILNDGTYVLEALLSGEARNITNPSKVSNSITFDSIVFKPRSSYSFISGNSVILKNNTILSSENGGALSISIDNNVCFSSSNNMSYQSVKKINEDLPQDIATKNYVNTFDEIKVYPNPTNEEIYIENHNMEKYSVTVYDVLGKLIKEFLNCNGTTYISMSDFPRGIYTFKLSSSSLLYIEKVIKK